jgi:hypothetical protein
VRAQEGRREEEIRRRGEKRGGLETYMDGGVNMLKRTSER